MCITADDPGTECQERIAKEIRSYVEMTGCSSCCIPEREEAVRYAVRLARGSRERTLILVLGRGSERYQRIGTQLYACQTDSQMLSAALRECER